MRRFAGSSARWPWLAISIVAITALSLPATALAGDDEEVDFARKMLDQRENQKAATRFERLLDAKGQACPATPGVTPDGCRLVDPAFIRSARGLYAIALNELKRRDQAKEQFKKILLEDPSFTPSPALFSVPMIQIFGEAKEEVQQQLVQIAIAKQKEQKAYEDSVKAYDAWIEEMAGLAAKESLFPQRSRFIAAIPFGVGQFQNGDNGLGAFFLTAEAVFLTGAVVTGAWSADLQACKSTDGCPNADGKPLTADSVNEQIDTLRIVNLSSAGLLLAAAIVGVIEAEVDFRQAPPTTRPRKVRARPPKPAPPPAPTVSVTGVPNAPDAYGAGVIVRF